MYSQSRCVDHGPCAACGSSDALAWYDDGHGYCYSCKKYYPPEERHMPVKLDKNPVEPPNDLTTAIPYPYVNWLLSKGLREEEIKDTYLYSPSLDRVVHFRPESSFYEARGMYSNVPPKVLSFGNKPYDIDGEVENTGTLILVEDLISSLKVGRHYGVMCLFGSALSKEAVTKIYDDKRIYSVIVWLDKDKYTDAKEMAKVFRLLNFEAAAIFTEHDPKWYMDYEIKQIVEDVQFSLADVTPTPSCCENTTGVV